MENKKLVGIVNDLIGEGYTEENIFTEAAKRLRLSMPKKRILRIYNAITGNGNLQEEIHYAQDMINGAEINGRKPKSPHEYIGLMKEVLNKKRINIYSPYHICLSNNL